MTWTAIGVCALGCYLLKLTGLSVPANVLEKPLVRRIADLLPIALLAALIVVQVFSAGSSDHPRIAVDARLAGLGAAVVALLLRAPFLLVVIVAAGTAALIRL
jgi:branched-subunit amino acid transport protein